jgi:hypothetical protein
LSSKPDPDPNPDPKLNPKPDPDPKIIISDPQHWLKGKNKWKRDKTQAKKAE